MLLVVPTVSTLSSCIDLARREGANDRLEAEPAALMVL